MSTFDFSKLQTDASTARLHLEDARTERHVHKKKQDEALARIVALETEINKLLRAESQRATQVRDDPSGRNST